MRLETGYGICSRCGGMVFPVYFTEEEIKVKDGRMWKTGRKRRSVSYLECEDCLKKYAVDDTFDGEWR